MCHFPVRNLSGERIRHMFLSNNLIEHLRSVFTVKRLIIHGPHRSSLTGARVGGALLTPPRLPDMSMDVFSKASEHGFPAIASRLI